MRINLFALVEEFYNPEKDRKRLEEYTKDGYYNYAFGLDINELYNYQNAEDYFSSEAFSKAINDYYEKLDYDKKQAFYVDLSSSNFVSENFGDVHRIYYGDNSRLAKNRAIAFSQIDSEEKYEKVGPNILYAALEYDLIPPEHIFKTLSQIQNNHPFDLCILEYLRGISDGKHLPIQLAQKEIDDLTNKNTEFSEKQMLSILNVADGSTLLKYLQEKRKHDVGIVFRALETENEMKLLEHFSDDPVYQAKLLLDSEIVGVHSLGKCFSCIEDDYIKYEVSFVNARISEGFIEDKDASLNRIKKFLKIKEEFLSLSSDEERKTFLINLTFDDSSEEKNALRHEKINQIKKSLLKFISSHENRMEIIESMAIYSDPDIAPYVNSVYEMVKEYFEDNCNLTDEQRERMEIAFRQNDVYFENYGISSTEGCTYHTSKHITIAEHNGDNPELLKYLIHEYSHAMSMYDFETTWYHSGETFEEGMADTFAEQVLNHYFQKHKEIDIAGNTISYDDEPIILSKTAYEFQNGVVKSMLYPLEKKEADKLAIQDYLLGDKKDFFDLVLGDDFSKRFSTDYKGNPIGVDFLKTDLVNRHYEQYANIDNNESLYFYTNDWITSLRDKSIDALQNMEEIQEDIEENDELSEAEKRIRQIQSVLEDGIIMIDKSGKMWAPPYFENETEEEKREILRRTATFIFEQEENNEMEQPIVEESASISKAEGKSINDEPLKKSSEKNQKKKERDWDER